MLNSILKLCRYIPGFIWFENQISIKSLLRSFLTLCIFGFVPGAWGIGLPILLIYGLVKHKKILTFIHDQFVSNIEFLKNFSHEFGVLIGEMLTNRMPAVLRGGIGFLMLFTIPMPFCFLGLYGLFRYSVEQWRQIFQQRLEKLYQFTSGVVEGVHSRTTFYKRLNIVLILAPILAAFIYYQGGLFVLNLALSLIQYAAISVGFSAFFRDLGRALKQPIKSLLSYTGIIVGGLWGRYLAHSLFPGRIYGNMGPAVGQVVQTGFLSSIFSTFLMPNSWFVGFETGFAYLLTSRFSSFINGIMNSVFFSYDMQLYGDFYGTIGPTAFQILLLIVLGAYLGYKIESWLDSAGAELRDDLEHGKHSITYQLGSTSRFRWYAAYVIGSSPLFLISPIGATVLSFASGNILLAQGGIMVASASMMFGIYATGLSVQYVLGKRYSQNNFQACIPLVNKEERPMIGSDNKAILFSKDAKSVLNISGSPERALDSLDMTDEELKKIKGGVSEVKELAEDVDDLLYEQVGKLDLAEENMKNANQGAEEGHHNVTEAKKKKSCCHLL